MINQSNLKDNTWYVISSKSNRVVFVGLYNAITKYFIFTTKRSFLTCEVIK